jgi:hypothetical protein
MKPWCVSKACEGKRRKRYVLQCKGTLRKSTTKKLITWQKNLHACIKPLREKGARDIYK